MKPERYEQIFGKAKSIRIIMDMYDKLNKDSKSVVGNTKAPTLHWFVVDTGITKKHTGIILDKKESLEAFSGANKFGKNNEATANCWLKGDPTDTITALLDKTKPIESHGVKAALFIRGYGKASNSACFLKDKEGWRVNSSWIKYFKLPKHFAKAPK